MFRLKRSVILKLKIISPYQVDQYLNIKLTDISVTDPDKYPHMLSVKNCFIRGSVVRYVQLPGDEVDTQLIQDATRKEAAGSKQ